MLQRQFIDFTYELYRDDKSWIPPMRSELGFQFSPSFPFYKKSGNYHKHFLAMQGHNIVGCVSAFVNSDLKDQTGMPIGTVGFFESADDYKVARELLDASVEWFHAQGIKRIWGPMNFDIWHGYRFMSKGFEEKLFYGEPYNKPYYPDFFQRYGFNARQQWNSVEVTGRPTIERIIQRGMERYHRLIAKGYRFENFKLTNFSEEVRKLYSLLTVSFRKFLGFTPITFSDFEHVFAPSRYAIEPSLFHFAYDENNRLVGFAGAFLEISDAVRSMKGRAGLMSLLKFFRGRRHVNRIMFHIGGYTPEEAAKRSGFGRAAFYYIVRQILDLGYDNLLVTLMAQGNPVRGLLRGYGADERREYTLYELNI